MDFGKVTIPTKWEEINLQKFCELMKVYEKEDRDILDVLEVLSGKTKSELRQMPTDFVDTMLIHLQFMNTPLNVEPDSKITINGKEYKINYMEKLKFGEWTDAETALKDKDYITMLAILCRLEGEIYDDDFIADKLDDRIKIFSQIPVTQAFILINFFLKLSLQSMSYSPKFLETSKEEVRSLLRLIRSSVMAGDGGIFSIPQLMIKLIKLERQLKHI